MYTPELYPQQPSGPSGSNVFQPREDADAGSSGPSQTTLHGGQYPTHSIPFTNQMAYQHNFTPDGFSYDSPFGYAFSTGIHMNEPAQSAPQSQRSGQQLELYPQSLADVVNNYISHTANPERGASSVMHDNKPPPWEHRRKSSDPALGYPSTSLGTGERFFELVEAKLGGRVDLSAETVFPPSDAHVTSSSSVFVHLDPPGRPIAAPPYAANGYPRYSSSSPHLEATFPSGFHATSQRRGTGERMPGDLGLRGYASNNPSSTFSAPHIHGQYFEWSAGDFSSLPPAPGNPFQDMVGENPSTIAPGNLGPAVPVGIPTAPYISPNLTSRGATFSETYATGTDASRTDGNEHHNSSWQSTRSGVLNEPTAVTMSLTAIADGPHRPNDRVNSPPMPLRSYTATGSPPLHTEALRVPVVPVVPVLPHSSGYLYDSTTKPDADYRLQSIAARPVPAYKNGTTDAGDRHSDHSIRPSRQMADGLPSRSEITTVHGHAHLSNGIEKWTYELLSATSGPVSQPNSSSPSSPSNPSRGPTPRPPVSLQNASSVPPLPVRAPSNGKKKRSVSDSQVAAPVSTTKKRKTPVQKSPSIPLPTKTKTAQKLDDEDGRKVVIACHHCRAKKLKCDGGKPLCRNCERRGEETCEYDAVLRRRGPGKHNKKDRGKTKSRANEGKRNASCEPGRNASEEKLGNHDFDGIDESQNGLGGPYDESTRLGSRFSMSTARD